MKIEQCKKWYDAVTIPSYMILSLTDKGMIEDYVDENRVDSDDLRIAIEISGGHHILIPCNARLVLNEDGAITIQLLKVCPKV